jgi:hypothetical protein
MGVHSGLRRAAQPLRRWGVAEYLYLLAFAGFVSVTLAAAGWGWWSLSGFPIFLAVLALVVWVLTKMLKKPRISGDANQLRIRYREGTRRVRWVSVSRVKYAWTEFTDPWTDLPALDRFWELTTAEGVVRIADQGPDRKILLSLFQSNLKGFDVNWESLDRAQWGSKAGEIDCWQVQ